MKKIFLIVSFLVIIGITAVVLISFSHAEEDEDHIHIMKYLDDVYGKASYTIQKDPEYKYGYLVKLKEYPELEFMITVSRQPFTSPYIWSDFDEVFTEHAIEQFQFLKDLGADKIIYSDPQFVYTAKVSSLEELKISYDKLIAFIHFVSEKYPILVDTGLLDIRLDISGLRLKGDIEDEMKYFDICEAKKGALTIKPYDEIYTEIAPQIKTHPENPNSIVFKASDGRSFSLGSDTIEDCFYKGLALKNGDVKELEQIILMPGEVSDIYTLVSTDNYHYVNIDLQAKNLTDAAGSLYEATIIKAAITGSKEIYIEPVWIELEFDKRREWIDPYKALKISSPKNKKELIEGVSYKNIKVLFEKNDYWEGIKRVTLTLQQ